MAQLARPEENSNVLDFFEKLPGHLQRKIIVSGMVALLNCFPEKEKIELVHFLRLYLYTDRE